ncbi:MAG TPA: hypothetical protein VI643_00080, partial [Planctomycetota bacterium]|nr:hypothetical protein [Planctomycetota bacterium]
SPPILPPMSDSNPPVDPSAAAPDPDFGRSQRNVPTKPEIPGVGPPKPPPAPSRFEGLDNLEKAAAEEAVDESIEREIRDLMKSEKPAAPRLPGESFGRGQRNISTAPDLPEKLPPKPSRFEGLDNLEKAAAEEEMEEAMKRELKDLAEPPRRAAPPAANADATRPPRAAAARYARLLRGLGIAVGVALVAWIGTRIFEHAADEALAKMGPGEDLAHLLPSNNPKAMWISAEFKRINRDNSDPHFEPNVVAEEITIAPPVNGVFVIGVPLHGRPPLFSSDCDINRRGNGNSDWLFQPFADHLIGRSASGADPLRKDIPTTITLLFHLPGFEAQKLLAERSGTARVYLIAR